MKQNSLLKKLTSRKFLMAAITAIAGIVTLIVGDSVVVKTIAGALMTIVPTVVYCVMEGSVDAASVKAVTDATVEAAEKLGASEGVIETVEQVGSVAESLVDDSTGETGKEEGASQHE